MHENKQAKVQKNLRTIERTYTVPKIILHQKTYEPTKDRRKKQITQDRKVLDRHTLYFIEPVSFLSSAAAVAFNKISSYLSSKASYKENALIRVYRRS